MGSALRINNARKRRIKKYRRELERLYLRSSRSRARNWINPYLIRIYELSQNWKKKKLLKERRKDLVQYCLKKSARVDQTVPHLLINISVEADVRRNKRIRWVSALRQADFEQIGVEDLAGWFANKGGIAERAREWAMTRRIMSKRALRQR